MPELSLVIPVMNEAPNIGALSERISRALSGIEHELIWVDDGSTDDTAAMIKKYSHPNTILIGLSRNYGQSAALQAGFLQARAGYIATLDGDGQNDPADLPLLFQLLKEKKLDMVTGYRAERKDAFVRSFASKAANGLIRLVTRTRLKDLGCSTRVMKKESALSLPLRKGMHRYINVLLSRQKKKIGQVPVKHDPRVAGHSKYGFGRIFPVLTDLVRILFSKTTTGPYLPRHFTIGYQWSAAKATSEVVHPIQ